jgi:hypothetical protein
MYNVTHNGISITFQIIPIDALKECGPHPNLKFGIGIIQMK